jgi:F5/8 type C domain
MTPAQRCAGSTCDDGVLNGSEPTIDCGAGCPDKCLLLETCSLAADCETQSCQNKRCLPAAPIGQVLSSAGWIATASNSFGGDENLPNAVLDGLQASDWKTGQAQTKGMWFVVDMLEPRVFFSIEIECLKNPADSATALDVWLSNDGTFADMVKENVPGDPQLVVTFAKPQVARYIKLSLAGASDNWWQIDEIRVEQ